MGRSSSTTLGYISCWILDIKHSMTEITLVLTANKAKDSITSTEHLAPPEKSLCGFSCVIFGPHLNMLLYSM